MRNADKQLLILGLLVLLMAGSRLLSAQSPPSNVQDQINKLMPNPVPATPNVSSLGKYGDYPVSFFSGIPDISIPLFEVKSGSLTLPITLSYHASGVKPTDVASWVGMGWSLSAGGQVSRNVRGKPDEEYYSSNALNASPSVCGTYQYLKNAATNVTDTEADIFSYSFPGKSGKFMLAPNGSVTQASPILVPYAPIVVKNVAGNYEITDESGVLYRFGTNSQGGAFTENTTAYNGGNPTLVATTAWHLGEIIAPNSNDKITFNYQSVGTAYTHDISHVFTLLDKCFTSNGGTCPPQPQLPQLLNVDSYSNQSGLSTIDFEEGRVEFVLGSTRSDVIQQAPPNKLKSLSKINIYSKVNGKLILQKSINFVYTYFTNANGVSEALKLDEVQFLDNVVGNQAIVQRYRLTYFTNSFSWNRNTTNFLNARDLWGYYNGATGNTNLLLPTTVTYQPTTSPPATTYTFGGAADRTVNIQYIKEGVLSRIDFPTGGYTQFEYEANKYLNGSTPTLAGGLRVTKITSTDGGTNPPVVKTYRYGNGESGYGVPNFTSYQYHYSSTQMNYSDCLVQGPVTNYTARTYYSNSAFSQDSYDASPIRYNYVTEYFGDPAGSNNGKTVYTFDGGSSSGDVDQLVPTSSKYYRNSYFWMRGKLTSKNTYTNTNQLVSSTSIQYTTFKQLNALVGYGVAQFITGNNSTCSGYTCTNEVNELINPTTFFFSSYYQNTGALVETSTTETTYESTGSGNVISKTINKTLDANKLQPLQTSMNLSNSSETMITVNTYPFQLAVASNSSGSALGAYLLNSKNIATVPLETYTYIQNTSGATQVISGQITTYARNPTNTSYAVPDKIYLWEPTSVTSLTAYSPLSASGLSLSMDAKYVNRINLTSYDAYGNLQVAAKTGDLILSYRYGYNNSLPIAEVKNAQCSSQLVEFLYESFEENNAIGVVSNASVAHSADRYFNGDFTVRFSRPNARSYIIEYWYYDTDNLWRYISKPYTGSSMTLTEGTAIDDVRIYPVDAQMKSYTYDPVLGIRSVIDESGTSMFYNYDTFGRLATIRDENQNILKTYKYNYKQ